jgi:hypothetical protein
VLTQGGKNRMRTCLYFKGSNDSETEKKDRSMAVLVLVGASCYHEMGVGERVVLQFPVEPTFFVLLKLFF